MSTIVLNKGLIRLATALDGGEKLKVDKAIFGKNNSYFPSVFETEPKERSFEITDKDKIKIFAKSQDKNKVMINIIADDLKKIRYPIGNVMVFLNDGTPFAYSVFEYSYKYEDVINTKDFTHINIDLPIEYERVSDAFENVNYF